MTKAQRINQRHDAIWQHYKLHDEWKAHAHDAREIKQAEAIASLLWDYLKRSRGHPDRREICGGSKTKLGLLRSVQRVLGETQ